MAHMNTPPCSRLSARSHLRPLRRAMELVSCKCVPLLMDYKGAVAYGKFMLALRGLNKVAPHARCKHSRTALTLLQGLRCTELPLLAVASTQYR